MPNPIEADWDSIKIAVCGGLTLKEAANAYGVPRETIKKRAQRQNWPTPTAIKTEAERVLNKAGMSLSPVKSPVSPTSVIAKNWAEKAESHRVLAFKMARKALLKADRRRLPLKDWSDIEKADKMARRASGLESEGIQVNVGIQLLNQRLEQVDLPPDVIDI
jgi:helix-turn-helix, Psq domain